MQVSRRRLKGEGTTGVGSANWCQASLVYARVLGTWVAGFQRCRTAPRGPLERPVEGDSSTQNSRESNQSSGGGAEVTEGIGALEESADARQHKVLRLSW